MDKPIKIFAEMIEGSALDQFYSAMKQDYAVQGALMPDTHTGYSLPIGAVVATEGVIVPSWVGYDIGCGMCAMRFNTSIDAIRENATNIFNQIYRDIPVGFKNRDQRQQMLPEPVRGNLSALGMEAFDKRGGYSALGTLGGGNHFIEIGEDEDNKAWIIIHSGSRGVGHGIATNYMRLASGDGKVREGHYALRVDGQAGQDYINDMNWALEFALVNRKVMMLHTIDAIRRYCDCNPVEDIINRNHNHAELKDGRWIHRKGATHAEEGMLGVIPGNMRDGSFIVRGKGNPESLCSSSHGAGRVMGRKKAKMELSLDDFIETMEGVKARVGAKTLDEAPLAYKDIFTVMDLQGDLVDVLHRVKPIINIKG